MTAKSPFPWRRKEGPPMTAIAAFQCSNGIVMSADTEETYPDNKTYTFKLYPVERATSRLCVAGSGTGYLIDYAKDEVVSALDAGLANEKEFEAKLREVMQRLYKQDFQLYPVDKDSDRHIQLLIGAQFLDQSTRTWARPVVFECQANLVTKLQNPAQRGRILGAGVLLNESAVQFANWGIDVELAERVSLYLMYEAKRRFTGVGGKTHMFTMKNDGTHTFYRGKFIGEQENVLEGFGHMVQMLLFALEPSVPDSRVSDFVNAARKWLKDARRYLRSVEQGKIVDPRTIVIHSSEIQKMIRKLQRVKPSGPQTSEPEQ